MSTSAEIRALAVTPDASLSAAFLDMARELGITTEISSPEDVSAKLRLEKYEALLIDFDSVPQAAPALAILRANPSNRSAVVFAIASTNSEREIALANGANFVFGRPVDGKELRRTLYAAYSAMAQERRRYFRCAAELQVFVTRSDGIDLVGKTGNISANGMSISSSTNFTLGEPVGITLDLQNGGPHVLATGVIVWDDKHGKTGISFQAVRPELQRVLDAWLDSQFARQRDNSLRELQEPAARSATAP
jgi:hypothetical protein